MSEKNDKPKVGPKKDVRRRKLGEVRERERYDLTPEGRYAASSTFIPCAAKDRNGNPCKRFGRYPGADGKNYCTTHDAWSNKARKLFPKSVRDKRGDSFRRHIRTMGTRPRAKRREHYLYGDAPAEAISLCGLRLKEVEARAASWYTFSEAGYRLNTVMAFKKDGPTERCDKCRVIFERFFADQYLTVPGRVFVVRIASADLEKVFQHLKRHGRPLPGSYVTYTGGVVRMLNELCIYRTIEDAARVAVEVESRFGDYQVRTVIRRLEEDTSKDWSDIDSDAERVDWYRESHGGKRSL